MATVSNVRFGGKKGKPYRLRMSDDIMVVRTQGRRTVRETQLSSKARDLLSNFDPLFAIPEVGVEVLRCSARRAVRSARDKARIALRREASVRFAGRGLCSASGRPILYTENVFVQFQEQCRKTSRNSVSLLSASSRTRLMRGSSNSLRAADTGSCCTPRPDYWPTRMCCFVIRSWCRRWEYALHSRSNGI